jgi:aminoglycoside phosphotransferase (APT) family kinase protein
VPVRVWQGGTPAWGDVGETATVEPGELLAAGRDADVFAVGNGRVLRRYRDGSDAAPEAEVMAYVAGHGFPVPAVHVVDGADLVLEHLDGPTMATAMAAKALDASAAGRMLAGLHTRLHALPAREGRRPGHRVLHLDLHPENVMLVTSGPVVIDWRNAADGPPELDVATTALILAQVAVAGGDSRAGLAHGVLAGFLADVGGGGALRLLDHAVERRSMDPNLVPAERERLAAAASLVRGSA